MITFLFAILLKKSGGQGKPEFGHNCRMWALVTDEPFDALAGMIRQHHDSLRSLSSVNADGWGISYFYSLLSDRFNPIVRKGEPCAAADPRYQSTVEEMIRNGCRAAVSHVRRASGSMVIGIPNPHPFDRAAVIRPLRVLFCHNGSIATSVLVDLINTLNPEYFSQNPPDYYPLYLDSDLYLIYLLETMDTYLDSTIESCIRTAVSRIDSALGRAAASSYLNFLMTDGQAVWACHYTDDLLNSYPLNFFPDTGRSRTWVAASLPMGKPDSLWSEVPNHTLVTLRPDSVPVFTTLRFPEKLVKPKIGYELNISYSSISPRTVTISYYLLQDENIQIDIYDVMGRRMITLHHGYQRAGSHVLQWHGNDGRGQKLPGGKYFCVLSMDSYSLTREIILWL